MRGSYHAGVVGEATMTAASPFLTETGSSLTSCRGYPPWPAPLQMTRPNGVRSLAIQCHQCRHEVVMNVDHLPGDLTVPSFGPKMVCTKCGTIGADIRPNWKECGW